jgi:hypothetical protein
VYEGFLTIVDDIPSLEAVTGNAKEKKNGGEDGAKRLWCIQRGC